ncbi:50S ribosomal protein L1 [Candidatus Daviesbacteria bacterium]|nr:50S ribosomal protein L1 [Candidatus Daviesbacteria bacterium]
MGRPKLKIIDDSKIQSSVVSQSVTGSSTEKQKTDNNKKSQKPGKSKPRSKKYQEITKDLDRAKNYPLPEAIDLVKKLSYSKFNATLEAHINTAQTGIRGLVALPFASGRKLKIVAFGKGAETSGADVAGNEEAIEEINKGKVNFDILVTTPQWMPKLAKVARILGPRGLMPNPKNGTVTDDLKKTVEGFQAGKTEYRTESKAPVMHIALGKLNQPNEELSANIKALLQTLGKTKVKKVTLAPTMGPAVKVDLASI